MSDYSSGYGQCKADLLTLVNEALSQAHKAMGDVVNWAQEPEEAKKRLQLRIEELRRVRAYIKSLKAKR